MPHLPPSTQKSWLLLFVVISAIWGSSFLFMRIAAAEFGAWPTSCMRMGIGALFMLPILVWRGQVSEMVANWKSIFIISLFTSAIPFACFAFAVLHISTGLSAILNATSPMFTALIAWLWLGQRLTAWRIMGIAIAFTGIVLLAGSEAGLQGDDVWLSILSIGACLLAALCYGASGNVVKQHMSHLHPWVIAGGTMLGATFWLMIPTVLTWPATPPSSQAWGAMTIAGVACSAIAFMLYFELMQRVDITRTSSVTYLITVFALLYGVLFLGEHLTLWMAFCGLVVMTGTALATGLLTFRSKASAA